MLGNAHARFCSGGGAGDCLADHNEYRQRDFDLAKAEFMKLFL